MSVCVLQIEVKLTLQTKLYRKIFHVENYCYYCQIASLVWRTGLTETSSRAFADTTHPSHVPSQNQDKVSFIVRNHVCR